MSLCPSRRLTVLMVLPGYAQHGGTAGQGLIDGHLEGPECIPGTVWVDFDGDGDYDECVSKERPDVGGFGPTGSRRAGALALPGAVSLIACKKRKPPTTGGFLLRLTP